MRLSIFLLIACLGSSAKSQDIEVPQQLMQQLQQALQAGDENKIKTLFSANDNVEGLLDLRRQTLKSGTTNLVVIDKYSNFIQDEIRATGCVYKEFFKSWITNQKNLPIFDVDITCESSQEYTDMKERAAELARIPSYTTYTRRSKEKLTNSISPNKRCDAIQGPFSNRRCHLYSAAQRQQSEPPQGRKPSKPPR